MKKLFKSLLVVVVCLIACLGFAGCDPKKELSVTTNVTTNIKSNGGIALIHDGWLYFINGTKTNNAENNKGKTVLSGIYRVKTNDKGEILYKQSGSSDSDKKEFATIEPVVQSLTGFKEGSIAIFGNFLYYATPCKDKNRDGEMLYNRTEFRRYDLVNKIDQKIYTTVSNSSDTIKYTYYKQVSDLYFVIYEQSQSTLKTFKIGNEIESAVNKTDVTSCLLSDNFGIPYNDKAKTDTFIYYTLAADEDSEITTGNRVYRLLPNGEKDEKISEGETVSLLYIKADYLIYSVSTSVSSSETTSILYYQKITGSNDKLAFKDNILCSKSYENIIFIEEEGKLKIIVYDGLSIGKIYYENGEMNYESIAELKNGDEISFIGLYEDYIIYRHDSSNVSSVSDKIYKIKYKNINLEEGEEKPYPILLSTTDIEEPDGLLVPEIMNGYVYGFHYDSDSKTTYLYRMSIQTPKEKGEVNDDGTAKSVGEAELIGVVE